MHHQSLAPDVLPPHREAPVAARKFQAIPEQPPEQQRHRVAFPVALEGQGLGEVAVAFECLLLELGCLTGSGLRLGLEMGFRGRVKALWRGSRAAVSRGEAWLRAMESAADALTASIAARSEAASFSALSLSASSSPRAAIAALRSSRRAVMARVCSL